MYMLMMGILSWWYTGGWKTNCREVWNSLAKVYDFFSIDLLLKTLFSPFRQVSAGQVSGPLTVQLRNFVDKLISRFIGAFMRTLVIIIGSLALVFWSLFSLLRLVFWIILPIIPIVGVVLMFSGWIPWKI